MKHRDIYQLTHIALIIKQIDLPLKELDRLNDFPIFRVEALKDNVILDQSCDIVSTLNQKEQSLKLTISSANFIYKKADLFSFQKVAKLSLRLFRMDIFWTEEQLVEEYKLTLSEYAYEYSRSITASFNQHVLGFKRRSFLYYTVQCSYQDRANKQNQTQNKLIIVPKLKKNDTYLSQTGSPLKKIYNGPIPIKQIAFGKRPQKEDKDVFISYDKLVPIYASDRLGQDKLKIDLAYSHLNIDEQKENSTIEQIKKLQKSAQLLKQWSFYLFIALAIVEIVVLMSPRTKIK